MAKKNPPRDHGTKWPIVLGICLFLVVITWLVFGQTIRHQFVNFDDEDYVYENPAVLAGLSLDRIGWAFTHTVSANWHPLTVVSHMLDCTLYGLNPGGHHFTNVCLHSIAVVLLFLVLWDMTGAIWRSGFVAAVFAIHPLRAESVAWISERKDVLSALFFMLTLGAYLRYVRQRSLGRYLVVAFLFALGLMSKPMLVTLPFVLLLLDYWPLKRFGWTNSGTKSRGLRNIDSEFRHLAIEKIPLFVLSAGCGAAAILGQSEVIAATGKLAFSSRVANAFVTVMVYVRQMLWPRDLALFYPYPQPGLPIWEISLSIAAVAVITIAAWMTREKRPYLLVGWLWYLGMLVPVIGIIQVGLQAHADRYTYLPQIGLYLLITWTVADFSLSWPKRRLVLPAAIVVLAALAWSGWVQVSYWRDGLTLWTHTLAVTSNNDVAHDSLCDALLRKGRLDEAIYQARTALEIRPDNTNSNARLGVALFRKGELDEALVYFQKALRLDPKYPNLHYDIATIHLERGRFNEAIAEYKKELQGESEYTRARHDAGAAAAQEGRLDEGRLQNNLGTALARAGYLDEALLHFHDVLEQDAACPKVHYNIANVLLQKGQIDEAIDYYQKELQIQPNYALAHSDLGIAFSQKGQIHEAIAEWQKAIELDPDNSNATCNLAWVFATYPDASVRDGPKALELAERAVQLSRGESPRVLRLVAAAYAEIGRFSDAIATAKQALQLATDQNNSDLVTALQGNIDLFKTNTPLRDTAQTSQSVESR